MDFLLSQAYQLHNLGFKRLHGYVTTDWYLGILEFDIVWISWNDIGTLVFDHHVGIKDQYWWADQDLLLSPRLIAKDHGDGIGLGYWIGMQNIVIK